MSAAFMQVLLAGGAITLESVGGAWSFVGQTNAATGSNPTITIPSGKQTGDLIIIGVSTIGATAISATGFSVANSVFGSGVDFSLLYKIADGSEGSSVAVTTGAGIGTSSFMLVYRATGTITYDTSNYTKVTTSASAFTCPAVTFTPSDLAIIMYGHNSTASSRVDTHPSGVTHRTKILSNITQAGIWVGDVYATASPTTGYVGTATDSCSSNVSLTALFKST